MKLSVLELPSEVVGDVVMTPFALVFHDTLRSTDFSSAFAERVKETTGARAVLVIEDEIEIV